MSRESPSSQSPANVSASPKAPGGIRPRLSVTIRPDSRCFAAMREASARVHGFFGGQPTLHPHITIQMTEKLADLSELQRRLEHICRQQAPFETTVDGLALLHDRLDPSCVYLVYRVQKSPQLLHLFRQVTSALEEVGAGPSLPIEETWLPHLTLAQGEYDQSALPSLERHLSDLAVPCTFRVEVVQLNEQLPSGEWQCLAQFRLTGDRGSDQGASTPLSSSSDRPC